MKITDKAKKAMTPKTKARLALALNCSIYTVDRWIKDNEENGDLTKASAVQIIKEETGLNQDEILEEDKVDQPQM